MHRSAILILLFLFAFFFNTDSRSFAKSPNPLFDLSSGTNIRVSIESPYQPRTHVYRGQIHAHSNNSDGMQPPREVAASYQVHGYDFIAITDHDHITANPKLKKILYIPGVEDGHGFRHFNRINAQLPIPFPRKPEKVIRRSKEEGSYSILNHPNWPDVSFWSNEDLLSLTGYEAIEIFSASCPIHIQNAEDRADFLLSHGRRIHLIASDDCHNVRRGPCFRSSVYVFSDHLTIPALIASLKSGNFYSSTGPTISDITVTNQRIRIRLPEPSIIEFLIAGGRTAQTNPDSSFSEYTVNGNEGYVRIRITRTKDGKQAWSNPFFISLTSAPS